MRILSGAAAAASVRRMAARGSRYAEVEPGVRRIVADVRRRGDRAVRKYAEQWDGLPPREPLRVAEEEIKAAWKSAAPELKASLRTAAANIRRFCEWQKPMEWTRTRNGITVGQIVRPLDSVGCYVPGGRYPLVSTLLMTVIPALVAGVENIRVVSPQPRPEVLAAAGMLGVREVYRVGGAQVIAALAYGTESLPRVDKIVGPGNLYVTAAKRLVAFECAIDMLAGPTEIVVTSERGSAADIASDLVAQAEHDPQALAIFITTREELARAVIAESKERSQNNAVAREALKRNGVVIVAGSIEEARAITNRIAPEHLTVDAASDLAWVTNAGSVFVDRWSAQPLGDYISGPNHTLPTGGMARVRGGLSVNDFVKLITVQEYTAQSVETLGPMAALLAEAEGLLGHAEAIRTRLGSNAGRRREKRG